MPIIKVENGYIYKKNEKNTKRKKNLFFFCLSILSLTIFVCCFFVFSKYDFTYIFSMNKYLIYNSKTYYAISLKQGESYQDISSDIDFVKLQDGAGYVYKKDNKYFLIASIYASKSDAEKVLDNVSNYDAQIVVIDFDRLILSSKYKNEQIKTLRYSLEMVDRFFETMNQIVVSYDRAEILDAEVRQKLQVFKEKCQVDKENFTNVFKESGDLIKTYVKIFQSEVISNISSAILSNNLSSDLKYIVVSTLSSFEKLQKNIIK